MIETIPSFLELSDGRVASEYVMTLPEENFEVRVSDFGGVITAIRTPGRDGILRDVVLGFDSPQGYLTNDPGFGALIGRVANRINHASFELDGKNYPLTANRPGYTLHGGRDGYQFRLWDAQCGLCPVTGTPFVKLHLTSPDGDQGFPGKLEITVTYRLKPGRMLELEYEAVTDAPTLLNLTNHCYFNLNGENVGDAFDHLYQVNADRRTVVDQALLPTGEIVRLSGSAYDFAQSVCLNNRRNQLPSGLDDNLIFADDLPHTARVYAPASGIGMNFTTTEPAVQLYTAYFLNGDVRAKNGAPHKQFGGFCLEAQHYPDSPHHAHFPSIVLRPGEVYHQRTSFAFDLQ